MASSSVSSSPYCLTSESKFDVFLSFRGEDTRTNFTSHLYAALCRKKIETFIDDEELERGDEISPALLSAIERSKIAVIIFSKDYASSRWCLNELVKILECHKINGQKVIPVFYHVDPSDVRKQTGSFGEAFVKLENRYKKMSSEKLQEWRDALTEASNLSGWASKENRIEAQLVDVIVEDILKKLEDITVSTDPEGLVGLYSRMEEIKSLLCMGLPDCRIVGIWGMGGIGKTTLAEALFQQISSTFEGKCFMANVREKLEKGCGLEDLQKQIISKLLGKHLELGGPNIPQYTKERLRRIKVFVVLDDVNEVRQLEHLVGRPCGFGSGSIIIVTTRDKQVLGEYGVDKIYEVTSLYYAQAVELFCNYAFRKNHRPQDLMELLQRVVNYAQGNPLALKVLGSFFHQKSKQDWENAIVNLKRISNHRIYDVLKISYDELESDEKDIFLDIACFFKGDHRDRVVMILSDDHSSVHYGLNVLVNKSLVTISHNRLMMHDLLQELGHEIVRQESIKKLGNRSRLWNPEDVYHIFKKNKGTSSIEGIFLDMSKIRDLHLTSEAFAKMSNLRLLQFYVPNSNMSSKVHLPQGLDYLPDELRYLHWHGYPLKTLPSNFSPDNLIELNLPYSKVEQLWEGGKEAFKLKSIDLHHSQCLSRIPDPTETPNIEKINLLNCRKLSSISPSIKGFNNLGVLSLKGCESLRCFPSTVCFRSPIKIDFSHCTNLTEFPKISGNVIELSLCGTAIEEIPSSIKSLTNLQMLDLTSCARLKSLSTSICKLKSLSCLYLNNCSSLESFPEIMEKMERLEFIYLKLTAIKELPSSFDSVEGLKQLHLWGCTKIDSLPENFGKLKSLEYLGAESSTLSQLPSSIIELSKIQSLSFRGCRGLVLPPLSGLVSLKFLDLCDCGIIEIPQGIGCLSSLYVLDLCGNNFESLPTSIKQLSRLTTLFLGGCDMLQSIPELPLRLTILDARNCKQLQFLPLLPSCLEEFDAFILQTLYLDYDNEIEFIFANCQKLNEKANNNILGDSQLRIQHMIISSFRLFGEKVFDKPPRINICLPGSRIPDWFSNQRSGSSISIELPKHVCNRKLIGFALCAVIELEKDSDAIGKLSWVTSKYPVETKNLSETEHYYSLARDVDIRSSDLGHLFFGFDLCGSASLPDGDYLAAVSFKFQYFYGKKKNDNVVKCCGVCPVYAHPNKTKPNTFTLKFEEECTVIRNSHDDFNDKADLTGFDEWEVEPGRKRIYREQVFIRLPGYNLLRKYNKQAAAVFSLVLEAVSVVLDQLGNKKLGFLLVAFILSAFGFAMTICLRITKIPRLQAERLL